MQTLEQDAKTFYESIKYEFFKKIAEEIELNSNLGKEVERIKLGRLYNSLQGIRYSIKHMDFSAPEADLDLQNLKSKFLKIKREFYSITGKQITLCK